MADWEFVDPATGLTLGAHAYGTVAAGTASTPWSVKLRYKHGLSGSGVNSNALVLEISEDGGVTWRPAVTEFTLSITETENVPLDPLFTERARTLGRGSRWTLAPFRAGCSCTLSVAFSPDLRTGAALQSYRFRLGIDPNASYQTIGLVPDAPSGVLSGIGCPDVSEWITAPTLANGTDLVTMGAADYVHEGIRYALAGGDVAHSQDDSASHTLVATEEYVAIQSVGSGGRTVTKGVAATAGTAVAPAIPAGELPEATVRVPHGGVIVTSTLHAVSGRCAVSDAGGLAVTVQPGRALVPGYLVTPPVAQSLTLADASVAATGLITCVAVASLIDGETVTLAGTVYEFDVAGNGVGGGNTAVDVSLVSAAQDVAYELATAINLVGAVGALNDGAGISLTHLTPGAAGNVAITDTVANAGFTHTGMTGGLDGAYTIAVSASGIANDDDDGAILADVVTAAGDIVSVTDRRRLLGLELVRLRQAGNETAGTAVDRVYVPYPWAVDSGAVLVRTASTGATGSTDVNVELEGSTFASGSIAAQGTSAALAFTSFSGAAGWITLDVAAITSGGSRAVDVEAYLWIARRP